MAIVRPEQVDAFMAVAAKWDVLATVIGEVTEGDRLIIDWHGETVVDVDPRTVADDGPVYERPWARPQWQDELQSRTLDDLPRVTGPQLGEQVMQLAESPNLCDKTWVTEQYDRYVRGDSVLAQPEDAGMLRLDEETGLGIALATDANGRYCLLNPYQGAQLALSEAYRNVAASGAQPVAITDCLNFGSPEDPDVMWQFREAVIGLVDGCQALGTPVTGGNVSFYNQTDGQNILPTPVVGMLGIIDNVADRLDMAFAHPGDAVALLGTTLDELDGSAWAGLFDRLGGQPPKPNFEAEQGLASVLIAASKAHLLTSAHDLSEGGLAMALVESCLRKHHGVAITLPEGDPTVQLFSESPARAVVSFPASSLAALSELCAAHGVPLTRLGEVTNSIEIEVVGQFTLGLDEVRDRWSATLPAAMAGH